MANLKFKYDDSPQRTAPWFQLRLGRVTASRLADWLAVSRAKATLGAPLKARQDYEKELRYERTFGVAFDRFVTAAMQEGTDYENFARQQYEKIRKVKVEECGCWHNEFFVASPDGIVGEDGLLEIKVLKDNSFTDVLTTGVPQKHYLQIQGQLWASGKKWCDYVAINLNTKKLKIIRVIPDIKLFQSFEALVPMTLIVEEFDTTDVYDFVDELPSWEVLDV